MRHTVLLVHGDAAVRRNARAALETVGYQVIERSELRLTEIGTPEVLLIEWSALNPLSESLRWIRGQANGREVRVLLLAERAQMGSAIAALELGADDCIGAPFDGEELIVRISASLRRPPAKLSEDALRAGPVELDPRRHQVRVSGQTVELAPTEFRLMTFLLEHQGRVFSREELLNRAWSRNVKAGPRTVDVHVRRLRQQLEPFGCESMIQTVRGFGYRLRAND
jgi:two-component system phosphate regulon response regulator PhoB